MQSFGRLTEIDTENYWGLSASIDLKNCDPSLIRSAFAIQTFVKDLCKVIDMKPFGECQVVHFGRDEKVAGFSMIQLIETSLISGHFANATNNAYIDIFSCKDFDVSEAELFCKNFFLAEKSNLVYTFRE